MNLVPFFMCFVLAISASLAAFGGHHAVTLLSLLIFVLFCVDAICDAIKEARSKVEINCDAVVSDKEAKKP